MDTLRLTGYISAITAGFMFGMLPVISGLMRDRNISSLEQVFIRLFVPSIMALFILIWYKKNHPQAFQASMTFSLQRDFVIQGILMTFMILTYLSSIAVYTPAGEAALLTQIHPFLTLLLGWLFLHEKITSKKLISLGIAILSIIVILQPWLWSHFLTSLLGDTLAMANGLFYALYIIIGRSSNENRQKIGSFLSISWVLLWAFITGYPVLLLLSLTSLNPSITRLTYTIFLDPLNLFYGLTLALFGSFIPYGLLMIAAKHVESSKTSILVLGEPIGALIFGFILLHEAIKLNYVFGGLLLGIAIYVIMQPDSSLQNPASNNT